MKEANKWIKGVYDVQGCSSGDVELGSEWSKKMQCERERNYEWEHSNIVLFMNSEDVRL